ncbi:UDP-3-O-(3-hydroxymyristoyl) glucosamine N- acyltransferase [Thermanaerovibrio acidaminovorans DSM 6589]|uniref:UDP-3-O-(3-hydroxymyristoyl) glucosamine N-acyltransferase n=1 Tax=Thermanaerovibrio acidaminovorans (strain ATCC 49978 / DSM 6589 / Su883) TaxID=525903 RepID=D1B683_THEAS|nr:UDP-3-O-(3-hydroxymyristoyl) glucosamine N- acyltransferase [Thermanaerovibrio acidaminovorans DSM 6589]
MRLDEFASIIGGRPVGDGSIEVVGVCPPHEPAEGHVIFWRSRGPLGVSVGPAGLVALKGLVRPPLWGVEVEDLDGAWVRALECFDPPLEFQGLHPTAVIHPEASIGMGVHVGPYCVVEQGAVVEDGAWLQAFVYVGRMARIGAGSVLQAFSVVQDRCEVGAHCRIHSCAVVGCDGFGFVEGADGERIKVPQIGIAVLGDRVEMGSCSTVDRATVGATRVMEGVKMDDHVHVAHNCEIGPNSVLVAYSGVAGSARLGRSVVMAAQSGVRDHVTVGDRCVIAARGGVVKDLPAGSFVSGFPARDHREELRLQGLVRRLPDLLERLKALEARVRDLESRRGDGA